MRVMLILFFASGASNRCQAPGRLRLDSSRLVLSLPLGAVSSVPITRKRVVLSGRSSMLLANMCRP
ncbi:hypothetical protein D3C83_323390 [compost metagenome]